MILINYLPKVFFRITVDINTLEQFNQIFIVEKERRLDYC